MCLHFLRTHRIYPQPIRIQLFRRIQPPKHSNKRNWLKVVDTVIGPESPGLDSWVGQIRNRVANGSPPLRSFFRAVLSRR